MASTPTAITVAGLRKAYGSKQVLDGVHLTVPNGSVFALLGPNGAGKTTIVHILSTLIPADSGELAVGGFDVGRQADEVRGKIGLTGQFSAVDSLLTGEENLALMGRLRHHPAAEISRRTAELLERFDLVEAAKMPLATYSGGMRRRLDLAMTLMGDPEIIFLDEPTTGLDPRSRRTMWDIIRSLTERGVTIFLTTQYLEEADQLADRIAVLDQGRIVAEGTAAELKRLVPGGHIRLTFGDMAALERAAVVLDAKNRDDDSLTLEVAGGDGVRSLKDVLDRLERAAIEVSDLSVHTPNLDDVFLALTSQKENVR
ncbi:ATP-binding cassette domain-containing protein [Pseudarthrobacter sp. SSS035]|uniref:ATP-binding cassette domain-containing protein n=1 Tax=Pseudarthrobacter sp. SSS035 TaxID=2931399 RepID=UPI00200D3BCD|nr:ATP-binding cassette domain-containing protein [Pseudarthrobacter sp. SSS035]